MIVKCVSARPSNEQIQQYGGRISIDRVFHVSPGREYIVLDL
jgi:hypothetical protein